MRARPATDAEVAMWAERDGMNVGGGVLEPIVGERVVVGGPEEGDGVIPCPALVAPAIHQGWPWVTHSGLRVGRDRGRPPRPGRHALALDVGLVPRAHDRGRRAYESQFKG